MLSIRDSLHVGHNMADLERLAFTVHNELLEGSSALAPFMREYAALIERGWARPYTVHTEKHRVLYAKSPDGVVMGGIVYALNQMTRVGWIVFSFTVTEFRRQGVYTALHSEVEVLMAKAGMKDLASHVHVDNDVQLKSCESLGKMPEFYRMRKSLMPQQ